MRVSSFFQFHSLAEDGADLSLRQPLEKRQQILFEPVVMFAMPSLYGIESCGL